MMKIRKRFVRVVIVVAVIILLLVRFIGKWRYDVALVPFVDVDSISLPSEHELVCHMSTVYVILKLMSNLT